MTTVTLLYFASLRERAGIASETISTTAADLSGLYEEVQARHGFTWPREHLRVAVDGEFARWGDAVRAGSEIAFIPPVSGG
ncbi:molybdopterin synthase sulfur carrier subunit [Pseudoxanthomonas sp. Root65]|uniref:molybdopterin converting factor subunit 1 n=1 Tax=Pseudoxanthomonas sp. Root65 TaxID=1736576 RepID=UPI0006FC744D|nr:molybdopterin converting factor subunit 1 [Pseudoxanthomonas sp. Root65]KRA52449.1 molybdopterin synthase sulfur carrier subunit [Pseudoxanthomonas sp. Root65]